jgi:ferredoxin
LCRCQGRIAAGAEELLASCASGVTVADQLCRPGGAGALHDRSTEACGRLRVGCIRESPLLESATAAPLEFFPAREYGAGGRAAAPRIAALVALARMPEPPPVDLVSYASAGRLAILGPGAAALEWARRLHGKADGQLLVTVFAEDEAPLNAASPRAIPVHRASGVSVTGWLGAFEIGWTPANPVDAALCTGCGACLEVCGSDAILRDGVAAYVDLAHCTDKRSCVTACKVGAIDFSLAPRSAEFDLVLDLADPPRMIMHHPPQGYFAPRGDLLATAEAALALTELVGEFEKPRYFDYNAKTCAHARSRIEGCSRCIETCSTAAIRPDGNGVRVEPHLCMGCGACASVCPSGAMRYNYPGMPHRGGQIRAALAGWQAAGGGAATLLLHGREEAETLRAWAETEALPPALQPLALYDAASVGPDLLLYALCAGAGRVVVWQGTAAPATYRASMHKAAGFVDAVLCGLDLARPGERIAAVCGEVEAALAACGEVPAALGAAAKFHAQNDKRATLEFCFRHLAALAPAAVEAGPIPLPAGSAYGDVAVAADKCTLCLACVSACPAQALLDDAEYPRLRFRETACVQCGLCVATCPEDALALSPQLDLRESARHARTLHEDQPAHCLRCGKPFGASTTLRTMAQRLSGHSLFATEAQKRRLFMCGDCRVIDMVETGERQEATALDL